MPREFSSSLSPLKYSRVAIAALLLLSIVLPTAAKSLALGLLILVLWLIGLAFFSGQIHWTERRQAVGVATLLFSFFGLLESLYGSSHGDPGAINVLTVYVIYPPLFFYLGSSFQQGDFGRLATLLKVATSIVIATQIAFVLSWLGIDGGRFAALMIYLYKGSAVVDKTAEFTVFTLPNVSSLMFLSPYLLADTMITGGKRIISATLFVLTVLACVLASRRAIYPTLALSVVTTIFLSWPLLKYEHVRARARRGLLLLTIIGAGIIGAAVAVGVVNPHEAVSRLVSLQNVSTTSYPRVKQFHVMMREVAKRPIIGEGAGAAASYIRSNSQPWAYELTYVDLLFQFGVLGCVVFACGFIYLVNCMMRAIKNSSVPIEERASILSFAVGVIGFVAANATNPYLSKFSYMWVIFIPIAAAAYGVDIA